MRARKRWVCPLCDLPGILAPGRMRKHDVRRYCLPCSTSTGKLVERTCPTLDKRRGRGAATSAMKVTAKREKARNVHLLSDGTDTRVLLRRARNLSAWGRQSARCAHAVKRCTVDIVIGEPSGYHGRAWGSSHVHVHVRRDAHPSIVMTIIVHELTHIADSSERGRGRKGKHDRFFWSLWLSAMQCVYPGLKDRESEIWENRRAWVEDRNAIVRSVSDDGWKWNPQNHYALEWANENLIREEHEAIA